MTEIPGYTPPEYIAGGQGKRNNPRPKIQGTQFKWKREKTQVKNKPMVVWIPPKQKTSAK